MVGHCRRCGNKTSGHRQMCPGCRSINQESKSTRCKDCGSTNVFGHRQICPNCRAERNKHDRRICVKCGGQLRTGIKYCWRCKHPHQEKNYNIYSGSSENTIVKKSNERLLGWIIIVAIGVLFIIGILTYVYMMLQNLNNKYPGSLRLLGLVAIVIIIIIIRALYKRRKRINEEIKINQEEYMRKQQEEQMRLEEEQMRLEEEQKAIEEQKRIEEEYIASTYDVKTYCPNCHRCNHTRYYHGAIAYGNNIECSYCKFIYEHRK